MVRLDSQYAIYLIDSGVAINLISLEYITERRFKLILKKEPYILNYKWKSYIVLRRMSRPTN